MSNIVGDRMRIAPSAPDLRAMTALQLIDWCGQDPDRWAELVLTLAPEPPDPERLGAFLGDIILAAARRVAERTPRVIVGASTDIGSPWRGHMITIDAETAQ